MGLHLKNIDQQEMGVQWGENYVPAFSKYVVYNATTSAKASSAKNNLSKFSNWMDLILYFIINLMKESIYCALNDKSTVRSLKLKRFFVRFFTNSYSDHLLDN